MPLAGKIRLRAANQEEALSRHLQQVWHLEEFGLHAVGYGYMELESFAIMDWNTGHAHYV